MRNNTPVDFDGVCIYIKSKVGAALIVKIILAGMNLFCWGGFIAISINIPREEF